MQNSEVAVHTGVSEAASSSCEERKEVTQVLSYSSSEEDSEVSRLLSSSSSGEKEVTKLLSANSIQSMNLKRKRAH